ncbi:MAG TPA: hypothetical protein VGI64_01030 [Streptosporangiaceae bacterium]|jgi:alpha-tubulin suppressor-like RCC1 family protein
MLLRSYAMRISTIAITATLAVPAGAAVASARPATAGTRPARVSPAHSSRSGSRAGSRPRTLITAGKLRGWGAGFGGVGDGTRNQRNRPVAVKLPASVNVTSVRSSCGHALAVTTTGSLLGWGDNSFGVLGDGTNMQRLKPVKVDLPTGTTVTNVRTGCQFTIALTSQGQVLAWGRDNVGQLGDGHIGDSFDSLTPVQVKLPAGTRVTAISIGEFTGYALASTGHVLAWGLNQSDQLGIGKKTFAVGTPRRVKMPAGTRVKSIAAGADFAFAVTARSALFAWGFNGDGQLGNGSTKSRLAPVRVPVHVPGKPVGHVTSLVAGCSHTLALTSTGAVLAWGFNGNGELGTGNTARHHSPVRVDLPAGTKAHAISAGCSFSMALTTSGHVLTWGSGQSGQLGIGSTSRRLRPARVSFSPGLVVIGIGSGPDATNGFAIVFRPCASSAGGGCHPASVAAPARSWPAVAAATAGTLRGWGNNENGALGDGTTAALRRKAVPVRLPKGTKVTSARSQCGHSLAVTGSGGVLAWGLNNLGQLGIGTTQLHRSPVRVHLPAGTKVSAVRAGCNFSIALTTSGQVLAWGFNGNGELGIGTTKRHLSPVRVLLPKGSKVTAISAGDDHSLALTSTGKVLSWGGNQEGQLGDTTTTSRHKPVQVALPNGTRVKSLAAGTVDSFALTAKSQMFAWGGDGASQLGDGQTSNKATPELIVFEFRGNGPGAITALAAGCGQTLAITSKGAVLAWGDNSAGQLGDGTTTSRTLPAFPKLPTGTIPKSVSASCTDSYVLSSTGHVYAFGSNGNGELGDGSTSASSDLPVRVILGSGFKATAIGSGPDADSAFAVVTR